VQEKQTINYGEFADIGRLPSQGRLLSIDPGKKRIGVAISDENRIVCRPLQIIERTSWKKLLSAIQAILQQFDAKGLVIGLPLESDGTESEMSLEARNLAQKFAKSLEIPVFLQDERVSSYDARARLWSSKVPPKNLSGAVDSEAAAVILGDFIDRTTMRRR
jgi:putative Holliday junction resolvase